jgi:type IV secretion system protein VirB6
VSTCPTFGDGGPSGIAEALRVVDCMSGEAASFAFSRLFGSDALLGQALTLALTLYIAFYAVGLLTGRTSLSVSSLTPRMMTLGIALTFATSWVAYQSVIWNLLVGAPDQIASLLIGSQGSATSLFADRLDTIFAVVAQAAALTEANASGLQQSTSLASGPDLLWLSALLLLLGTVGVLLVARIALAAMLALGPIFIICGLFEGSRGLFEGWIKAAVLFALTPLLAVLIGGATIAMLSPMLDSLAAAGGQVPLRLTTTLFLAAAVYCALMALCLKIAGTMVAGWRLPFSSGRDRKDGAAAAAAAQNGPQTLPAVVEPASATGVSSDPRMRSIISAASAGASPAFDRAPAATYPLYAPATQAAEGSTASAATPFPRSDPRLGSLSRHYRPRNVQFQRTHS